MERVFGDDKAFLSKSIFEDKELLEQIVEGIKDELEIRPEIIVYGKICKQNREVGFFSDESIGYEYSNKIMKSKPLSESLNKLLTDINKLFDTDFNGILVNRYNEGCDSIGAHSDNEYGLDKKEGVVAISYGTERIFRIRGKMTKKIVHDESTTHCGILQMGGSFQSYYTHEIPVQKKVKGIRYSFTFRKHIR
jgi:alkylated DNA repair dioxygenase AlkB